MTINEKLDDYIKSKGIKQKVVADRAQLSADTLSKILRNERKLMADEFLRICVVLDVDPGEFRTDSSKIQSAVHN